MQKICKKEKKSLYCSVKNRKKKGKASHRTNNATRKVTEGQHGAIEESMQPKTDLRRP